MNKTYFIVTSLLSIFSVSAMIKEKNTFREVPDCFPSDIRSNIACALMEKKELWTISQKITCPETIRYLSFNDDAQKIIGHSNHAVCVWSSNDRQMFDQSLLVLFNKRVCSARFTPDAEKMLILTSDNIISVYSVTTPDKLIAISHDYWIKNFSVSPDSKKVVLVDDNNTIRICDIVTGGGLLQLYNAHEVYTAHFNLDGNRILSVEDRVTRILCAKSGDELSQGSYDDRLDQLPMLSEYSDDSIEIVTRAQDIVSVWDVQAKKLLFQVDGMRNNTSLDIMLASLKSRRIKRRSLGSSSLSYILEHDTPIHSVHISNDEKVIATFSDKALVIWKRYRATLEQAYLYKELSLWLLVKKYPCYSHIKEYIKDIEYVSTKKRLFKRNIHFYNKKYLMAIWDSFPSAVQDQLWNRIKQSIYLYS